MLRDLALKANDLVRQHHRALRHLPHHWGGYPGICVVCYLWNRIVRYRELARRIRALPVGLKPHGWAKEIQPLLDELLEDDPHDVDR